MDDNHFIQEALEVLGTCSNDTNAQVYATLALAFEVNRFYKLYKDRTASDMEKMLDKFKDQGKE